MDRHLRLTGWANLVLWGGLPLAVLAAGGWLYPEAFWEGLRTSPGRVLFFLAPVLVPCALGAAAGAALLRGRRWARPVLWGLSVPGLLLFPVGTAVAVWTLWTLHRAWEPGARTAPFYAAALAAPALVFALPWLHTIVHFEWAAAHDEDVVRQRRDALAFVEEFVADQHHLAALGLFEPNRRERDAGSFLNARVAMLGAAPPEPALHFPIARLSRETRQQTRYDRPATFGRVNLELVGLDFRWMNALLAYDHWRWEAPDHPAPERLTEFTDYPMPDFLELRAWVRLRLEAALAQGDLALALGEVRHLAGLLYSTNTLVGALMAVEILDDERRAVATWQTAHPGAALEGTPLTESDVVRARRALWAMRGYTSLHVDPALMQRVLADPEIRFGRCAALNEEIPLAAAFRPLVEERYAAQLAQLDAALALDGERCAVPGSTATWERGHTPWSRRPELERRELFGEGVWLRLPGIRSAFARFLLSVGAPDAFRRYRES